MGAKKNVAKKIYAMLNQMEGEHIAAVDGDVDDELLRAIGKFKKDALAEMRDDSSENDKAVEEGQTTQSKDSGDWVVGAREVLGGGGGNNGTV
jgi:hypothetical protein